MHSNGTTSGEHGSIPDDSQPEEVSELEDQLDKLETSAQALIGQHLKAVYGEIVREPIPDRLLRLIDELERKEDDR
jgi:hypothetical protein